MEAITGLVSFIGHFVVLGLDINRHELTAMLGFQNHAQLRGVDRLAAYTDLLGSQSEN